MGCCECHDHKYDPFKARDFYAMAAYFSDIKQWGVYENYTYSPEPELKGLTNDSPFPPEIEVESPYLKSRLARLSGQCASRVAALAAEVAADPVSAAAAREWASRVAPAVRADPAGWTVLGIVEARARRKGAVTALPDQSARFELPKDPLKPEYDDGLVITSAPAAGTVALVRMEVLPDPASEGRVTNNAFDESFTAGLDLAVQRAGGGKLERIDIADGYPEQLTETYFNGQVRTSIISDWTSPASFLRRSQSMEYVLGVPITFRAGDRLVATVNSENVSRVRLSVSPLGHRVPGDPGAAEIAAALTAGSPTPAQARILAAEYFKGTAAAHPYQFGELLDDMRQIAACRGGMAFTTVTVATTPALTRVLPRGNWQDESGAVVLPSPPRFLLADRGAAIGGGLRQTRLDLANWIVSRDNPLTARAFVNRLWKQFFGTGLSAIVDDLGSQGEYPSHPELLDWLAADFMDRGWDVKAMVRTIVLSATYRQSSTYRPELAEVAPNNRMLARQ